MNILIGIPQYYDGHFTLNLTCVLNHRTMAMRQQNMDDRRRAMMNEMYSRPGANGISGQSSAIANAADEEEEVS